MAFAPVFVEASTTAALPEANVCTKIRTLLAQQGVAPLPTASNYAELEEAAHLLAERNLAPALFVVNTFDARELLKQMDPLFGEFPVLFLRRSLFAGKSGLMDLLPEAGAPAAESTLTVIGSMQPRLTAIWMYGAKNSDQLARRAANLIQTFLHTRDFRPIEIEGSLMQV